MRLPIGWDTELNSLDERLKDTTTRFKAFESEMETEIARIRNSYSNRLEASNDEIGKLGNDQERAWAKVRTDYHIEHPVIKRKSEFVNRFDAAEVLAYYWQGEELDHQALLRGISGIGDDRLYARAFKYAKKLTGENTPERRYVLAADGFLWKKVR